MVLLKFTVMRNEAISESADGVNLYEIELGPVYNGSPENKKFFAMTPSGSIKFTSVNEEAAKELPAGKEMFVAIYESDTSKHDAVHEDVVKHEAKIKQAKGKEQV